MTDTDPLPKTLFLSVNETNIDINPGALITTLEETSEFEHISAFEHFLNEYVENLRSVFTFGGIIITGVQGICLLDLGTLSDPANIEAFTKILSEKDSANLQKFIKNFQNSGNFEDYDFTEFPFFIEPISLRFSKSNNKMKNISKHPLNLYCKHLIIESITPNKEQLLLKHFEQCTENLGFNLVIESGRKQKISPGLPIVRYIFREVVITHIENQQNS